jgi:hypothetical protein
VHVGCCNWGETFIASEAIKRRVFSPNPGAGPCSPFHAYRPLLPLSPTHSKRPRPFPFCAPRTARSQEEAVSAVARAVRRARVGLKSPNRPIASFIFAGPTGVGKSELAKTLASYYFGSEVSEGKG